MTTAVTPGFESPDPSKRAADIALAAAGAAAAESAREIPRFAWADRSLRAPVAPVAARSEGPDLRARSELASRIVNVVAAALGLVLLAPLMALIALAIKLTSKGPVLYTQTRVGLDRRWKSPGIGHARRQEDIGGRPFVMFKFRTMQVDAERDGKAVWAARKDPRVTAIGRVLRKTRLDELPQLYNVLRGEMNIVGPRPERPCIFAQLRTDIPTYALRQRVKPGITGWAQINQAYDTCLDDVRRKVEYDIEYLQRQSLAEDLRIMAMTVPVMLFRRGGW
jgi:lipopolysaccharide/colanic/teichoic acid biosynthesis glycosyltransferase